MSGADRLAMITGGAGFIATNVADRLLREGWHVRLFDNLSRSGVERNVEWLEGLYGDRVSLIVGDVRDAAIVREVVAGAERVFHFAAQVGVTTSLVDPVLDFEVNARGTLNVLEAIRALPRPPSLLFTSSSKVYGPLEDLHLHPAATRYEPDDARVARHGISERRPLDFRSPCGCSKGAADQYVLDYARTFGLRATVFRMSGIYGPHQFGTEDQGWVAHFLICALQGQPLTLYGDGLQVRDVLFVEDLVDAMMVAHDRIDALSGRAYNIGGGCNRTVSLLELIDMITATVGVRPRHRFEPWRAADQRYYVSDTSRFQRATGWLPRTSMFDGIARLSAWLLDSGTARAPRPGGHRAAS